MLEPTDEKKGSRRSSVSSARSFESDFSIWTDTGDFAEQLADVEDSFQIRLRKSVDRESLGQKAARVRENQLKRVHYPQQVASSQIVGIDKEAISIPRPNRRRISGVERVLAVIMSPNSRQTAQMHGLVGKPLL